MPVATPSRAQPRHAPRRGPARAAHTGGRHGRHRRGARRREAARRPAPRHRPRRSPPRRALPASSAVSFTRRIAACSSSRRQFTPTIGADVALLPAILADRADAVGELRVVGGQHAAIAERAEVLGGVERVAGDLRPWCRPCVPSSVAPCAWAQSSITATPCRAAAASIGVEVAGLAVEMHRDHRADRRQAGRRVVQHGDQLVRVHGVGVGVDVEQQRRRADHLDRGDRGDRGVGDGGDRRTRPDAQAAQGQRQRVGAVGAADGALRALPGGVFLLEGLAFLAEDVPAGGERARDAASISAFCAR